MQMPPSGHIPSMPPKRGTRPERPASEPAHALRGPSDPFEPGQPRVAPLMQLKRPQMRGFGRALPNSGWLMASGLLFVAGAGVLLAAVLWSTGDTWRVGAAARPAISAEPAMAGPGVTLLLTADAPITEHHMFWLDGPRRLVVDVMGVGQAVAAPVVGPEHPLVQRVRWGRHDDRVRFVIEVSPEAHHHVQAHTDGASLAITLHASEP